MMNSVFTRKMTERDNEKKESYLITDTVPCDLCGGRDIEFSFRMTGGPGVTTKDLERAARNLALIEHKNKLHNS